MFVHVLRRHRIVVLAVIAVAVGAYVGRRPVLTAAGNFLIVRDEARPADAIVVLSGSLPDRILEAVDLYQAGFAPRIILTREAPLPGLAALRARGGRVAERYEQNMDVARQLGVPAAAISIVTPDPSSSTLAEASGVIAYLQEQRIDSILLVTSKTHARRAGMIFRALAGPRLRIALSASRYDPFTAETWWQRRSQTRRALIEYGKLLTYLVVDRWRLRAPAPPPA